MKSSRLPVFVVMIAVLGAAGCGASSSAAGTGGSGGGPAGSGGTVGGGTGGSAMGSGGSGQTMDGSAGDAFSATDASSVFDLPSDRQDEVGPPAPDCFPPCIANARLGCWRPATGACTYQTSGSTRTYSYPNGVTEVVAPLGKLHTFSTAARPKCFEFEDISPPAADINEIVFRDATGSEIARGTHGFANFIWTITCQGQSYTVDEYQPVCKTVAPGDCTLPF